jgi:dipeptidyl aminopeptidase/acylaminoacyl peptidase
MKNMEQKYNSIDEVLSLPRLSEVRISENGENVAYVKRTTDWEENSFRNTVWIYENGKHYPILNGKGDSENPSWSPDSSMLAYIGENSTKNKDKDKENGKNQIFLKTYDENNGMQLTNCNEEIKFYKWSPDGKGIYFVASEVDSEEIKNRKKLYGDFKIIDKDNKRNVLYYIEIEKVIAAKAKAKAVAIASASASTSTSEIETETETETETVKAGINSKANEKPAENTDLAIQITNPKDFSVYGFDVSSDLKSVLLVTTPSIDIKDSDNTELQILSLDSGKLVKLDYDGTITHKISFSPDNAAIAFAITPHSKSYYANQIDEDRILKIHDLESGEKVMDSSNLDREFELVKWTDKGVVGIWQDKTCFRVGMFLENGEIKLLNNEDACFIESVDITSDGENIACIKADEKSNFEVYLNGKQITNESKIYENKLQSKKELVEWPVSDGNMIEGVLSLPVDFDQTKKYPLLVVIHGGPTWASFKVHDMSRLYPIEEFVGKGYIVLEPNYRGSSGYGNKFRIANYRNLGVGDYEDVISGVDMLIEKGYADKDRVGVMGWSQGGYISAMCSTYSDRFKAISVGAGISNWMTYYVNTDITAFTLCYLGANFWNDPEIYALTSPMTYIKQAKTPTLIQHGDKDGRVPLPNAFELYRGLKDVGVEAELITYDGMGHSPNKPRLMKAIMEQNMDWFVSRV